MAKAAPQAPSTAPRWTKATLPRVVLVVGAETALREEALAAVRAAAFGDSDPGLSWVVLHGPTAPNQPDALTPATFLDEVRTSSMFAAPDELKVVLVRQADVFLTDKDYREMVERNVDELPKSATLVLEAATFGKLKTTRLYKDLAAKKAVVECEPLAGRYGESPELEVEVGKRARAKGLALAHGALLALLERSARNLGMLEEELDKLALALRPISEAAPAGGVPVSEEDVAEICASTRTYSAFNFVDALLDRDAKRSLEILGAVFERGIADAAKPGRFITNEGSIAMVVLGALTWKLSQLQDLQAAIDAGQREQDAFAAAKIFGFRQDGFRRTLRKHSGLSLRRCMDALFQANLDLRRSGLGAQEVLERLVWTFAKS
jgi:DNA polymerase III delta subunit